MKSATKKSPVKAQARGLGKGLSALMSDSYSQTAGKEEPQSEAAAGLQTLALDKIQSGKYQPRGYFDETALSELTESVRVNGVMQPILVRLIENDRYEIIAGERRWRASKLAGLDTIPVIIRELSDEQALELALIENVQRSDLHPLEEGMAYQRLMDEFGYTQEQIASTVHKSRSHIANLLRLLSLPKEIRLMFAGDKITMGHARALMPLPPDKALWVANEVVDKKLSVRQTERKIRLMNHLNLLPDTRWQRKNRSETSAAVSAPQHNAVSGAKDPDILALEETLSENLGLKVSIEDRGQSGTIMISYESLEQLDEILRRLGGSI